MKTGVLAQDLKLSDLLEVDEQGGVIRFGGRRILFYDAVALGLLRAQMVENFGLDVARGLLTRLGYSHGWRTAETLKDSIPWTNEREWRIAGGRLHRLQGLVRFEPVRNERPGCIAEAIWFDSFEAEQHVLHLGRSSAPVCWSLTGFASGYLSRVFGEAIYAIEETCCGQGDATCHMLAKTKEEWGEEIEPHLRFYEKDCLDETLKNLRHSVQVLESRVRGQRRALGEESDILDNDGMVVRSRAMQEVLALSRRLAAVGSTVHIRGESGVGKERVARYIHDHSARVVGPFLAINCGAMPENLLETELFGHVRGAFSGAVSDREGLFEAAHGGTLLLDEIGDIPQALQVRLLRVLQERTVRRVGENIDRKIDVRILSATHKNLLDEVKAGRFREDLYYRLKVIEVVVPPLRDRLDDILPIAHIQLKNLAAQLGNPALTISPSARKALLGYAWPGNVRQLQNIMERAAILTQGSSIEVSDLGFEQNSKTSTTAMVAAGDQPAYEELTLAELEKIHILRTLEVVGENRTEAAKRLGIGVATLYRKLRKYGLN